MSSHLLQTYEKLLADLKFRLGEIDEDLRRCRRRCEELEREQKDVLHAIFELVAEIKKLKMNRKGDA